MTGHTPVDAVMSYMGAAIQGQIINQFRSGGDLYWLLPIVFLVALLIVLGMAAASADLSIILRWGFPALILAFLMRWTAPVDVSILAKNGASVKSYDTTRDQVSSYGVAEANQLFLWATSLIDTVVTTTIKAVDKALGGPDYTSNAFVFLRAFNALSTVSISNPKVRGAYTEFLDNCYGASAKKAQETGGSGNLDPIEYAWKKGLLKEIPVPIRALEGKGINNCRDYYDTVNGMVVAWASKDPSINWWNKLWKNLPVTSGWWGNEVVVQKAQANALKEYYGSALPSTMDIGTVNAGSRWDFGYAVSRGLNYGVRKWNEITSAFKGNYFLNAAPKIQGYVILVIYVLFPFVVLAAMLPGRISILGHYFGAIFWVKSLSIFWMLIHRVSYMLWNMVTTNQGIWSNPSDITSHALDQVGDATGFITWVTITMLMASPLISYFILMGGMSGLMRLQFAPRYPSPFRMLLLGRSAGALGGAGGGSATPAGGGGAATTT